MVVFSLLLSAGFVALRCLDVVACSQSAAIDRQYVQPTPSVNDSTADWWWMNAQANAGVDGNLPANIQVVFYMGYVLGRPSPNAPQFYADVDGLFPNGTAFHYTLPATNASVTTFGSDQQVTGAWDGVGTFITSPDVSYQLTFSNTDILGSISINSEGTPQHYACNSTTSPFFDSVTPPGSLSSEEEVLFKQLGWAISIPSGQASVSLTIDGSPLTFQGTGYHDQNFVNANQSFADVISEWFFGTAQVGPYVFSYLKTTAVDSDWTVTTGFLAQDGVILQNQCRALLSNATVDAEVTDTSTLTPWGVIHSDASDVDMPAGYVVEYVLTNGDRFRFNLTDTTEVIDEDFYHRSVGSVSGGKEGEEVEDGVTVFEWLNPGLNRYTL